MPRHSTLKGKRTITKTTIVFAQNTRRKNLNLTQHQQTRPAHECIRNYIVPRNCWLRLEENKDKNLRRRNANE